MWFIYHLHAVIYIFQNTVLFLSFCLCLFCLSLGLSRFYFFEVGLFFGDSNQQYLDYSQRIFNPWGTKIFAPKVTDRLSVLVAGCRSVNWKVNSVSVSLRGDCQTPNCEAVSIKYSLAATRRPSQEDFSREARSLVTCRSEHSTCAPTDVDNNAPQRWIFINQTNRICDKTLKY